MRGTMYKVLKVMLPITVALVLAMTSCAGGTKNPGAVIGQPAPDFQLKNLEGQSVSLSDFKGSPVLLNFWSTRCSPCVYEMPFLQEIYDEWSGKGLILLAIDQGDGSSNVKVFMQDNGLSLPVLLDTQLAVGQRYNVMAIPTTVFIDREGIIQEKVIGAFPNKAEIEKRLSKIAP
jgi:peroxiredoxin